jgi:hypothetical protein
MNHLLNLYVLGFLFIIFLFFLFQNHLCEDSLDGVFDHLFIAVWLKLRSGSSGNRLTVLMLVVIVHDGLVYDAFDDTLIFNASQKRFVAEVLLLIRWLMSTPGHEQVLLLLYN